MVWPFSVRLCFVSSSSSENFQTTSLKYFTDNLLILSWWWKSCWTHNGVFHYYCYTCLNAFFMFHHFIFFCWIIGIVLDIYSLGCCFGNKLFHLNLLFCFLFSIFYSVSSCFISAYICFYNFLFSYRNIFFSHITSFILNMYIKVILDESVICIWSGVYSSCDCWDGFLVFSVNWIFLLSDNTLGKRCISHSHSLLCNASHLSPLVPQDLSHKVAFALASQDFLLSSNNLGDILDPGMEAVGFLA